MANCRSACSTCQTLGWLALIAIVVLCILCFGGFAQISSGAPVPPSLPGLESSSLSSSSIPDFTPSVLTPSTYLTDLSAVTLAWNKGEASDGSIILAGIYPRQYIRSWNAGTNSEITIKGLPGGFTWFFCAADYFFPPAPLTNHTVRLAFSGDSSEVIWFAPCPLNDPQLVITNGVWCVMCQISGGGVLQTSNDLLNWTNIGNIPTNAPMLFTGPTTNQQFFRVQL